MWHKEDFPDNPPVLWLSSVRRYRVENGQWPLAPGCQESALVQSDGPMHCSPPAGTVAVNAVCCTTTLKVPRTPSCSSVGLLRLFLPSLVQIACDECQVRDAVWLRFAESIWVCCHNTNNGDFAMVPGLDLNHSTQPRPWQTHAQ